MCLRFLGSRYPRRGPSDSFRCDATFVWNVRNHSPNNTASYPRRRESTENVLWDPQIWLLLIQFI